jgi:hypothetical protein
VCSLNIRLKFCTELLSCLYQESLQCGSNYGEQHMCWFLKVMVLNTVLSMYNTFSYHIYSQLRSCHFWKEATLYCSLYRCYATIMRSNMRCLVVASKHINDIWAVGEQPPITTGEKLLDTVFSLGSTPRLYSEDSRPAV